MVEHPTESIFPEHVIRKLNRTDMTVELINGTTIRFSGTEAVDNLLGETTDLILFDEFQSMNPEVFFKLQPMVSTRDGDIVIAGTVRSEANQMWQYYLKGLKGHPNYVNGWRSWKVTIYDSPTPNGRPEAIEAAKNSMSEQQFRQEYMCDPAALSGRI